MRAAFVVNEFPAISETFVLDQVTGLIDRGCEVDLYARYVHPNAIVHPEVTTYALLERTTSFLPPLVPSRRRRVFYGIRDIGSALLRDPVRTLRTLDFRHFANDALTLKIFYRSTPFLRSRAYDIVHCHFGPNGALLAELREAKIFDLPLLTQFHGYDASSEVVEDGYRKLFAQGTLCLCVSDRIRRRLIGLGCDPDKARVHHTGVRATEIPFTPERAPALGAPRLLTVGRLVEKKGIADGIRSVSRLISRQPGLRYTIVGDGPERAALTALVRELGIVEHVDFLGVQTREKVTSLMQESHLLLAPSVTARNGDEEGIPVVLMEALASGLPVVSTTHAGIPELVQHEVSGLLAPEGDVAGLAAHVERLLDDDNERRRLVGAGRRIVEDQYDSAKLASRLIELYREVLESTHRH